MNNAKKAVNRLLATLSMYIEDILFVLGISLISLGFFIIWVPLGFIVLGILLIVAAIVISRGGGS